MDADSLDGSFEIERQIERCRRLASMMSDDEIRHSLEQLAREYEAQLARERRTGAGFMLQHKADAP